MTIYCGVDFHVRVRTISYCDAQSDDMHSSVFRRSKDDVGCFYSQFSGDLIIGLEA